jgi:tricorn protease-like protein
VANQLTIPNKRARLGPKVASKGWRIKQIKASKPATNYLSHFTKYQIAQFKVLAELDYQVMGERVSTQGAPDSGLAVKYPIKLKEKNLIQNTISKYQIS